MRKNKFFKIEFKIEKGLDLELTQRIILHVEGHEFAQNKDSYARTDGAGTSKTEKDGFMEAPEGEIPFD